MKLLLIEDNIPLAARMRTFLRYNYVMEVVHSGDEALHLISNGAQFDVIILDLGLPDVPGLVVCQRLRDLGSRAPILVVTGDDSVTSRVELLNAGADDFVVKPFHADEIKARLAALLRRPPLPNSTGSLQYADLVIDSGRRAVTRSGTAIQLRRKEFDILEYLVQHPGQVITREMILDHVWDSTKATWTGVVDVHIKRLRDKVDRPFSSPLIKTAYGLGYRVDAMGMND